MARLPNCLHSDVPTGPRRSYSLGSKIRGPHVGAHRSWQNGGVPRFSRLFDGVPKVGALAQGQVHLRRHHGPTPIHVAALDNPAIPARRCADVRMRKDSTRPPRSVWHRAIPGWTLHRSGDDTQLAWRITGLREFPEEPSQALRCEGQRLVCAGDLAARAFKAERFKPVSID